MFGSTNLLCSSVVLLSIIVSAVVVPFGAVVESVLTLEPCALQTLKFSEFSTKFHGVTSTNPALLMRVPLDARVNDKSPDPSVGIAENTVSSLYPDGIITNDAEFNKSLINYRLFNLFNKHETPS
jgi:hypothetical protein